MTTYTDVFGGANIYPSDVSYLKLLFAHNQDLVWPSETSVFGTQNDSSLTEKPAAKIIELEPMGSGLIVRLPDTAKASPGETILFINRGSYDVTVNSYGNRWYVVTVSPGQAVQVYSWDVPPLTVQSPWRVLYYGAAVANVQASSLVGVNGIIASGPALTTSVPVYTIGSYYLLDNTSRAALYVWTGSSGTITLPSAVDVGGNWYVYIRNSGDASVTLAPDGSETIDGMSSLVFQPGESALVATDGYDFYTVGLGQPSVFAFDYTVINVAGMGDYILAGTELNRVGYKFTGALTGNRDVIVPTTVQQYWVDNQTTGAYTLTIKTSAGAGISLATGQRAIFYCDGTDVVDADTSTVSLPMQVSQGGTGAVTASAARANLGATSLGSALFTASSESAIWASLGVAPSGVIDGGTF